MIATVTGVDCVLQFINSYFTQFIRDLREQFSSSDPESSVTEYSGVKTPTFESRKENVHDSSHVSKSKDEMSDARQRSDKCGEVTNEEVKRENMPMETKADEISATEESQKSVKENEHDSIHEVSESKDETSVANPSSDECGEVTKSNDEVKRGDMSMETRAGEISATEESQKSVKENEHDSIHEVSESKDETSVANPSSDECGEVTKSNDEVKRGDMSMETRAGEISATEESQKSVKENAKDSIHEVSESKDETSVGNPSSDECGEVTKSNDEVKRGNMSMETKADESQKSADESPVAEESQESASEHQEPLKEALQSIRDELTQKQWDNMSNEVYQYLKKISSQYHAESSDTNEAINYIPTSLFSELAKYSLAWHTHLKEGTKPEPPTCSYMTDIPDYVLNFFYDIISLRFGVDVQ